jgi:hypothetical protein
MNLTVVFSLVSCVVSISALITFYFKMRDRKNMHDKELKEIGAQEERHRQLDEEVKRIVEEFKVLKKNVHDRVDIIAEKQNSTEKMINEKFEKIMEILGFLKGKLEK